MTTNYLLTEQGDNRHIGRQPKAGALDDRQAATWRLGNAACSKVPYLVITLSRFFHMNDNPKAYRKV